MATAPMARIPAWAGWRTRQVAVNAKEKVTFHTSGHQRRLLPSDRARAPGVMRNGISMAMRIVARPIRYLVQYQDCAGMARERQKVLTPPCRSPMTAPTPIRIANTNPPVHRTGGKEL